MPDKITNKKRLIMEFVHMLEYIESVSPLIGEQKALELLKNNIVDRRMRWYEKNKGKLTLTGKPLDDAYFIITERLKILDDSDIVQKGERSLVFQTTKPCPVHEACQLLKIDHKRICKAVCEASANDFLAKINPRLVLTIEHKKGDIEDITEETIELKER